MVSLYLVRHGQDSDNAAGVLSGHRNEPLTPRGRKQAQRCAEKLLDAQVDVIVSSPLRRALETAEVIAAALDYPEQIVVESLLIERDFGVLTGTAKAAIDKNCRDIQRSFGTTHFLSGPGVEDYPSAYSRAQRFLRRIIEQWSGQTVLVVTHGDIGKMIRAVWLGISWREGLEFLFPNGALIKL